MANNFLTWTGPGFQGANIIFGRDSKPVKSQGALVFTQVCIEVGGNQMFYVWTLLACVCD